MEQRHIISAQNILKKIAYINIATVNKDGSPWNTPVAAHHDEHLHFFWGSNVNNVHSQNIKRDGRVFVTMYDSTVPEGTGEGLYMTGIAKEVSRVNPDVSTYEFIPERVWINDEAKNLDGTYKHDIRVELDLTFLK